MIQKRIKNIRTYRNHPFRIAVIHGGPGAAGEMAPVAKELSADYGVLEPLQTASSVEAQVRELKAVLLEHANLPVILIGFSWGAWLSLIFAALNPEFVRKLILIGCGSLEEKYATDIDAVRISHLNADKRAEVLKLLEILNNPAAENQQHAFARFGALYSKADAYDPMNDEIVIENIQSDIFMSVWPEAAKLRRSGKLLEYALHIQCPVTAIHGDYDPHSAEGVREPLAAVMSDFRWILLERCGHKPWIERQAREEFYRVLRKEMAELY